MNSSNCYQSPENFNNQPTTSGHIATTDTIASTSQTSIEHELISEPKIEIDENYDFYSNFHEDDNLNYNYKQQNHHMVDDTISNCSSENLQESVMRNYPHQNLNYHHQQQQYYHDNCTNYNNNNNNNTYSNYYQTDNNSMNYSTTDDTESNMTNTTQLPLYYKQEPVFRPPSPSYYSHNYPPHKIEYNSQMFGPPPSPQISSQMLWYNHQQYHHNQYQNCRSGVTSSSMPSFMDAHQQEQMINMLHFPNSNGREARNRAEKQRRDKLNGSIADLATMVPHVAESPRRIDKTAVLRYSAHGLRIRYVFGKSLDKPRLENVKNNLLLSDSLMKLMDGFLLSVTYHGQIVLISPGVEQHLGHCQTDLFGQSIKNILHPEDYVIFKKNLIPTNLEKLFDIQPEDENGEPRPRTEEEENEIDLKLSRDKREFVVRFTRATPRSEPTTYEIVKIDGCFRRADSAPRGVKASTYPSVLLRRARGRDDSMPLHSISGNDIVLVAMARIIKPPKIFDRFIEADQHIYKTRHLIDGRIIECEQKISLIAGYMTDEVNGLSPFTFIHHDDVRWVIVALRQMYDSNCSYGESCYRLMTRTKNYIYLKTRGYLEVDKTTNEVHSFICVNTLVNEEEGLRNIQEMKNKFSIIINAKMPESIKEAPACDTPQQLEKAIIYLTHDLNNKNKNDENVDNDNGNCSASNDSEIVSYSKTDCDNNNKVKINNNGKSYKSKSLTPAASTSVPPALSSSSMSAPSSSSSPSSSSRIKSPTFALILPETSTIKSSISESIKMYKGTINSNANKKKHTDDSDTDSNCSLNSNSGDLYFSNTKKPRISNNKILDQQCSPPQLQQERPSVLYKHEINNFLANPLPIKEEIIDYNIETTSNIMNYTDDELLGTITSTSTVGISPNNHKYKFNNSIDNKMCNSNDPLPIQVTKSPSKSASVSLSSLPSSSHIYNSNIGQPTSVLKRSRTNKKDNVKAKRLNTGNTRNEAFSNSLSIKELRNPHEELDQVLTSSFDQLSHSLSEIESATANLRDQCNSYTIPNSRNQLEDIIEEHHDQKEMLENIQNEYVHFHRQTTINNSGAAVTIQQQNLNIINAARNSGGGNNGNPNGASINTIPSELKIIHPGVIEKSDDSSHRRKIIELKPR